MNKNSVINMMYAAKSTMYGIKNIRLAVRRNQNNNAFLGCKNTPVRSLTYIGKLSAFSIICILLSASVILSSCHIYSFKDVSIPPEVKTVKIGFIENKARYVNPQISPRLTDRLQQKITGQTRLTRTNNDDAHYQISGYISDYSVSTAGISNQQVATNRLTVAVHIIFRNTLLNKTEEFDASRNFDFSATKSLNQAEGELIEDIVKNLTDEIFNRIFSNW